MPVTGAALQAAVVTAARTVVQDGSGWQNSSAASDPDLRTSDTASFVLTLVSLGLVLPAFLFGSYAIARAQAPSESLQLSTPSDSGRSGGGGGGAGPNGAARGGGSGSHGSQASSTAGGRMDGGRPQPVTTRLPVVETTRPPPLPQDSGGSGATRSAAGSAAGGAAASSGSGGVRRAAATAGARVAAVAAAPARLPHLAPNAILWFLNAAFLGAMAVFCGVSLTDWAIAINDGFDIDRCLDDWSSFVLLDILKVAQGITMGLYFITSVWIKHRLVRSLPGLVPVAAMWVVAFLLCGGAVITSAANILLFKRHRMLVMICTTFLGLGMATLPWFYVYLTVRNIKDHSASFSSTLRIIRSNPVLKFWFFSRPIFMTCISMLPIIILLARRAPGELIGYIAIMITSDFLFEYAQLQKGLFAMLVNEISLPPNVRQKLEQALEANTAAAAHDADWDMDFDDKLEDFELPVIADHSGSASSPLLEAASLYVMAEQDHHIRNIILAIMFVGLLLTQLEMRMAFSALFQPADQAPLSITQKAGLRAGATLLHLTLMFPAYVASPADLDTILKMWFYAGSAVHTVLLSCVGCVQGYVIITALLKSSKHISAQVYRRKYIDLAVYLVLSVTAQLGVLGAFVMMSLNSTVKTKPVQQLFEQFGMACIGSEAVYTTIALRIMTSLLASNAQRPKHDSRRAKENKIETVAPEDDMPTTPANTEAGIRAMQQSTQDTQLASTHVRSK